MSNRRDNRLSPTATLHSKHQHERRNQEIVLKNSPSGPVSSSATMMKSKGSVMSKSLTLDLVKEPFKSDPTGKPKPKKKTDVEKSLKSVQRQTAKSKMSQSLNGKDSLVDNKTRVRDTSPVKGKVLNNSHNKQTDKKREPVKKTLSPSTTTSPNSGNRDKKGGTNSGENVKKADVFARLSRQDCNKTITRLETNTSNRIRDRSPTKTDQKSPQDKNATSDKHRGNRKSTLGDTTSKNAQHKKRDSSPIKRDTTRKSLSSSQTGSIGRRKVIRESPPVRDRNQEDKDDATEKLEKDNVPESLLKDLEDMTVKDEAYENLNKKDISSVPHQREGEEIVVGRVGGIRGRLKKTDLSVNGSPSKEIESTLVETDKVMHGALKNVTPKSEITPKARVKQSMLIETTPAELCKEAIIQKVRQRVPNDSRKDSKGVIDDDKDVCEADKCDEEDFYKIKVQTRLVSYSNSTLVIKNTSKNSSVGDLSSEEGIQGDEGHQESQQKDTVPESSRPPHPPTLPSNTLQSSSVSQAAEVPLYDKVDSDGGATALPTEAHQETDELKTEGDETNKVDQETNLLTRSRSMKLKLSQFVCKGKNFLTDVYSATQNKLEQYTKVEVPVGSSSNVQVSNHQLNCLRTSLPNEIDSGYYSISTSLEGIQHLPSMGDHTTGVYRSISQDTCDGDVHLNPLYQEDVCTTDGRADTPDSGMKIEDEEALPEPPAPHVNFKLNEDWIKKNILCTCKCKKNLGKLNSGSLVTEEDSASQSHGGGDVSNADAIVINESNSVQTDSVTLLEDVQSSSDVTKDTEDDLCLCSCHEGEDDQHLQQLPKEVLDILDADHARMWWTITGNFGNILPIDWSKTYTRQQYLPVLNLNETKAAASPPEEAEKSEEDETEEEEEVAQDLDLHHMILNGLGAEPVKSAEEVIKEIDDLMQEGSSSEDEGAEETSPAGVNANEPVTQPLPPPLYAEKLNNMSIGELNESFMELELVIRQYSETLINQLALRDELEYEKELKNSFISLLLQVQNKRRNFNVEKKKQKKYLTTVIPYDVGHGPPQNETLQILIKILMAINEDSPTVPTLLTDYILKVLCPS